VGALFFNKAAARLVSVPAVCRQIIKRKTFLTLISPMTAMDRLPWRFCGRWGDDGGSASRTCEYALRHLDAAIPG